jgi:hypothetical protein
MFTNSCAAANDVDQNPDKLNDPATRLALIAAVKQRRDEARKLARQYANTARDAGKQAKYDFKKAKSAHGITRSLVFKSESIRVKKPARAKDMVVEAAKAAIIRNESGRSAIQSQVAFEKAKFLAATYLAEASALREAVDLLVKMHMRGAQAGDKEKVSQLLNVVDGIHTARDLGANTPLPNFVPANASPERSAMIAQQAEITMQMPVGTTVPGTPGGGDASAVPQLMRQTFSSAPQAEIAAQAGIPGNTGVVSSMRMLPAGMTTLEGRSVPSVSEVDDGARPQLQGFWDSFPRLGHHVAPSSRSPFVPRGQPVYKSYVPSFLSPKAPGHDTYVNIASQAIRTTQDGVEPALTVLNGAGLAGVLAADLGDGLVTTTAPAAGSCDFMCQLQQVFAVVGPQVGAALTGAGGAQAGKGDAVGGAIMGLVGSALSFFGTALGGGAVPNPQNPPAQLNPQLVKEAESIMGLPAPVVYVGGGLLGFGLVYALVKATK